MILLLRTEVWFDIQFIKFLMNNIDILFVAKMLRSLCVLTSDQYHFLFAPGGESFN